MKRRLARWKECRRTSAGGQPRAASLSLPEGPLPSLPSRYKREYAVPPAVSRSFLSPLVHSAIRLVSHRRRRSIALRSLLAVNGHMCVVHVIVVVARYHPEPHLSHTRLIQPSFPSFTAVLLIRVYPRASGPRSPYLSDRDLPLPLLLRPTFPSLSLSPFLHPATLHRHASGDTRGPTQVMHGPPYIFDPLFGLFFPTGSNARCRPRRFSRDLSLFLSPSARLSFSSRCRALEGSQLSPSFFRGASALLALFILTVRDIPRLLPNEHPRGVHRCTLPVIVYLPL